jgi:hypothetical protein
MRNLRNLLPAVLACLVASAVGVIQLRAGGPLAANSTTARKYPASAFPLTYRVDQGTLGSFSNTTATGIVTYSFWEWDSIQSAALSFNAGAQLGRDVTSGTDAYITGTGQWSDGINPIVFDTDGSITDAKLGVGAKNSVLGFAASAWTGTSFVEGYAIINGNLSGSGTTSDQDRYRATITHEIGHFLGLGHSQVTMHADFATMYPIIQKTAQKAVSPDDTSAMAWLYPATGHTANVGSISGTVKSAANANLSGVVVLAVDSATGATYSSVVDYYSGDNTSSFTSRPAASGSYTIAGLPPGRYYVRIEPTKTQFSGGSSLASYSTPVNTSIAREWYSGASESGDLLLDDQNQKTAVTVTAGSSTSGINIIADESATTSSLTYHNATASTTWPLPFGAYTGYAVRFTAPSAGSLVGVKVRMEASSTMPLSGTVTFTVHANSAGSLAGIPGTVLGSVSIPYSDLSSNQENDIWLRGIGVPINFASGADFHVAITTNGVGTIALQSDNGATTQNRTSYYTTASGWRNMPQGMSGGTPGYNLQMSAIYTTSSAGNPTPSITVAPTTNDFGRSRPNVTVDRIITVSNPGTASLSVSAAAFTGVDASAFTIVSGGAPFTVAAGATHQMTVRWTPRRGGTPAKSATLSLTSDAPTSPTTASLSGTVIDPIASKLMASVTLGSKRIDSTHASSHTVLRNTGNDTLNVSSIVVSGADAGTGIRLLSAGGATRIAPDSSLTVRIELAPTARRAYAATLTINHDDSTGSTSYAISGTGIAPLISASSDSLDHGNVRVQSNGTAELWLRNSGNAPMSVSGFSFIGADSTAFQPIMPATFPTVIAVGDSTLVRVRFAPTARRGYSATLRVATDAIPATMSFALAGRGVAPVASMPQIAVIGTAAVGASIETQALAIRNLGDAPLSVTMLSIGGAHASEFSLVGTSLPATIAPGDSLPLRVRFQPTVFGSRTADLSVASDDPLLATSLVTLTASALQGQLALVGGARLDFGDVTIATSVDRTARFANSGSAPLVITGIAPTGSAAFTMQLPTLPLTIAPGDTIAMPLRFTPTVAGSASARVTLASNGVESSVELELVGRGVAPGLALDRSAIIFGAVPTNQSRVDSFIVRNTGALPLTNVTLALNGASASSFEIVSPSGSLTIAPGATQSVVVRLQPQSVAGARSANVQVTATGGAASDVSLAATIVESMLETTSEIDFGVRPDNAPVDTVISVRNRGTMPLGIDSMRVAGTKDGARGQFFIASMSTPVTLAPGELTEIRIRFTPMAGAGSYIGQVTVFTDNPPDSAFAIPMRGVIEPPAGIDEAMTGPGALRLSAIRPNPASSSAWLSVRTPARTEVTVMLTDLRGRMIAKLFEGETSGEDHVLIDASVLDEGEYLVTVRSKENVATRRFVVVR